MNVLWSCHDLRDVFPEASILWDEPVSGISIDTRTLQPGDLFFAIRGEEKDGHDFLDDAFRKGAVAACVCNDIQNIHSSHRLIRVPDTLKAMERLAYAARDRARGTMIGVTGSVGKTSVKDGLKHLFERQGSVHASPRSYNNQYGVPLTLAQMHPDARWGILEMGMNHNGEMRHLTSMVKPHIAIITTIAPAHLAFFESEEQIADAKAEIFESMKFGSHVFLPRDNPHYERLYRHATQAHLQIITFGQNTDADCQLLEYHHTFHETRVQACILGRKVEYCLSTPGVHRVLNSLALLGCVMVADGDLDQACQDLESLQPTPGRGVPHVVPYHGATILVLDESYNANPSSMTEALKTLACYTPLQPQGRRIAILGDMRELGPQADALHASLAEVIAPLPIHHVITCGAHMHHLHQALSSEQRGCHQETSADIIPLLPHIIQDGDVVMMKGSLGSRMKIILDELIPPSSFKVISSC